MICAAFGVAGYHRICCGHKIRLCTLCLWASTGDGPYRCIAVENFDTCHLNNIQLAWTEEEQGPKYGIGLPGCRPFEILLRRTIVISGAKSSFPDCRLLNGSKTSADRRWQRNNVLDYSDMACTPQA